MAKRPLYTYTDCLYLYKVRTYLSDCLKSQFSATRFIKSTGHRYLPLHNSCQSRTDLSFGKRLRNLVQQSNLRKRMKNAKTIHDRTAHYRISGFRRDHPFKLGSHSLLTNQLAFQELGTFQSMLFMTDNTSVNIGWMTRLL